MPRGVFFVILCFSLFCAGVDTGFAVPSISLEGLHIERSQGTEVLLDLLQNNGCGIKWTHITMKPALFGITGEVEGSRKIYPGSPSLTLRLRSGARRVTAIYRLEWKALMAFAARDIERGQTLSADDLGIGITRYKRSYGNVFSDMTDLVGRRARRRIGSGDVISERDVEQVMTVERGDRLTIISRSGGVEAKLPGLALESGSRGSAIRVRIGKYRKDIRAIVMGPGMAIVKEGI